MNHRDYVRPGDTIAVRYLGEASSVAELVAALKRTTGLTRTRKVASCPECGRRLTWLGKQYSLCALCLRRRN